MRTISILALAMLLIGCSSKPYTGETEIKTESPSGLVTTTSETREILPGNVLAGSNSVLREISAQVASIDIITRQLTLKTADRKLVKFKAGPEIRNFNQIKPGDVVNLSYLESIDFEVRPPTKAELAAGDAVAGIISKAPLGSKPGVIVGAGGMTVLTVDSIDKDKQLVTLLGKGGPVTVKAMHPENLSLVKKGDTIVVTVTENLIANVEPAS